MHDIIGGPAGVARAAPSGRRLVDSSSVGATWRRRSKSGAGETAAPGKSAIRGPRRQSGSEAAAMPSASPRAAGESPAPAAAKSAAPSSASVKASSAAAAKTTRRNQARRQRQRRRDHGRRNSS